MPQDSIPFHLSQKEAGVFKNTALVCIGPVLWFDCYVLFKSPWLLLSRCNLDLMKTDENCLREFFMVSFSYKICQYFLPLTSTLLKNFTKKFLSVEVNISRKHVSINFTQKKKFYEMCSMWIVTPWDFCYLINDIGSEKFSFISILFSLRNY